MDKTKAIPLFTSKILYFDDEYDHCTADALKRILEKNGFYPPTYMNASKLTRGKYIRYAPQMDTYLADAYTGTDILFVGLTDACSLKSDNFWKMEWMLTFDKFRSEGAVPRHRPWNVLSFSITYDKLHDEDVYARYFQCVKDSIELLQPFYARMDDVETAVSLSERPGLNHVLPEQYGRVRAIHWGNYFGREYCDKYGLNAAAGLLVSSCENLGDGILFLLTDSALEYASKECTKRRNVMKRMLGISDMGC